jgi:adenylyltransferase/sulfurtransferase
VPGQIGLVQATEILKLILGIGTVMIGKFYFYRALTLTTNVLEIGKNPECPLCGKNPHITGLVGEDKVEYETCQRNG